MVDRENLNKQLIEYSDKLFGINFDVLLNNAERDALHYSLSLVPYNADRGTVAKKVKDVSLQLSTDPREAYGTCKECEPSEYAALQGRLANSGELLIKVEVELTYALADGQHCDSVPVFYRIDREPRVARVNPMR